ncbi:UDP-N-acetylmuramoyl-tripeptide--D-alanyl-D-alanine ligase [Spelaeicoccus albus]
MVAVEPEMRVGGPVVTDSREITEGSIFVARRGESLDGHDFAISAIDAGAALVIGEHEVSGPAGRIPMIVVDDATVGLAALAQLNLTSLRSEGDLQVVAITGSAGKTTVKDLTASLLAGSGETIAPYNSYNGEVGAPLTALRADTGTRFLVLEMGARHRGNLKYLTDYMRPDISVVLNVGSAHSGVFGGPEAIAATKGELVDALEPGGTAILNYDDDRVRAMASRAREGVSIVWFTSDDKAVATGPTVTGSSIATDANGRSSFDLTLPGEESVPVTLSLLGEHHVPNALAAAAIAWKFGIEPKSIPVVLSTASAASRWRMELIDAPGGYSVLNDAYNANPESMRAALKTLAVMGRGDDETPARRTWAVLGEMLELGDDSVAAHDSIGRLVVRLNISKLIAVGEGARAIYQAAAHEGSWGDEAAWVPDIESAHALLEEGLRPGDLVLFKSSRDAGLRYLGDEIAGVVS